MIKSSQVQKFKPRSKSPKSIYFKNTIDGPVYVLPEITAISPVTNDPKEVPGLRGRYAYKVYMVNMKNPVLFAFKKFEAACRSREQLIFRLYNFWDHKKVLTANGWSGWVTVASAVRTLSPIFKRGNRHVFTVTISNLSDHLDFVFTKRSFAEHRRTHIIETIGLLWIDQSRVHSLNLAN